MRVLQMAVVAALLMSALAACTAGQAPWSVNCENQAAARGDPGFYTECMRRE